MAGMYFVKLPMFNSNPENDLEEKQQQSGQVMWEREEWGEGLHPTPPSPAGSWRCFRTDDESDGDSPQKDCSKGVEFPGSLGPTVDADWGCLNQRSSVGEA